MSSSLPSQFSDAESAIDWALREHSGSVALSCSFGGPTGMVVLDMVMRRDRTVPVYYLDTGLLFPETYHLARQASQHYRIDPIPVRPDLSIHAQGRLHGPALWDRDPDRCCDLRKVQPQTDFLRAFNVWITGLRRDQGSTRKSTPTVEHDRRFGVIKLNPLAEWSGERVWAYVRERGVPYNELNDVGYPSVGCTPCTRAVLPGEDPRAGRWPGAKKTECGLHAVGENR